MMRTQNCPNALSQGSQAKIVKPRTEITEMTKIIEEIKFKAEFKKKTNWLFAIFIGIWILGLILITGTIIWGLTGMPERISDFAFVLVLSTLIGAWILDRFLWQIHGSEVLVISDKIEIIKTGKLFESKKSIDFYEYESISFDNDTHTPFWLKLYGLKGGKIRIKYLDHELRVGQDITLDMAESVSKEFNDTIEKSINIYVL